MTNQEALDKLKEMFPGRRVRAETELVFDPAFPQGQRCTAYVHGGMLVLGLKLGALEVICRDEWEDVFRELDSLKDAAASVPTCPACHRPLEVKP